MQACVIGLGTIGLATAQYVSSRHITVYGYDIKQEAVEHARQNGVNATGDWAQVPKCDVYLICTVDSSVTTACEQIQRKIGFSDYPLVSIESTVTPEVPRHVFEEVFDKKVRLVHVPHRYWIEQPTKHGVKQLRVIGAVDWKSLNAGVDFYKKKLGIPVHQVASVEVAAMSKIMENAHRYYQIAFAEEMRMICESVGLRFEDVRCASNTHFHTLIYEARQGIGGTCLPKDSHHLASLSQHNRLLKAAFEVDREYREWLESAILRQKASMLKNGCVASQTTATTCT